MESNIIVKVNEPCDSNALVECESPGASVTTEEVLIEVRGHSSLNSGDVILASGPPTNLTPIKQDELPPDSDDIDVEDFMDIVTIKCRSCSFFCSTKSQLKEHIRTSHKSGSSRGSFEMVSEEQRQLISSLLELANEKPRNVSSCYVQQENSSVSFEFGSLEPDSKVFLCGECSMGFTSSERCNDHVIEVHRTLSSVTVTNDEAGVICRALPERDAAVIPAPKRVRKPVARYGDFVVDQTLATKPLDEISRNEVSCPFKSCNYIFTKEKLELHFKCHDGSSADEKNFTCFLCCKKMPNWRTCAMHLWRCHQVDVDLLTCPTCKTYKTITPAKLDVHVMTHSESRHFSCSVCKKKFKQLTQLRNHAVTHLDKDKDPVPAWYKKKICNLCDKYFADSKCLKKHVQAVHSKLRPYICQVCNHQSARKSMLEMHMRQHTGEKPYQCNDCSYRTADHNSLRRHRMRHIGAKSYHCKFCDYASIQSESYKRHMLSKHPNEVDGDSNIFVCSQCPFKAVNIEAFVSHQKKHLQEEMKNCDSNGSDEVRLTSEQDRVDVGTNDSGRISSFNAPTSKMTRQKSSKKFSHSSSASRKNFPVVEDEDSLHAATDLGGTTIPAT